MNIPEKSVNNYAENRLARKIAPWYAMIATWALAPLMFFGFLRYKKRYVIFPVLFLISVILMSYFSYCESVDITGNRNNEYYSYLHEVEQNTIDYVDYQAAKEMSSYGYMLDIFEEYDLLDKTDKDACISFINELAERDDFYSLEITRPYYITNDGFSVECSGYSIIIVSESLVKVNPLANNATNLKVKNELDKVSNVLKKWQEERDRIRLYNEGYYTKTDETDTIYDKEALAVLKKYENYIDKEYHQFDIVYAFVFMAIACGIAFAAMVTMSAIAGNNKIEWVDQVEKEVFLSRGKAARKAFVQELCKLSRERNAEEFNLVVATAHADYELRKSIILTKSQVKALTSQTVAASAILDGEKSAKAVNKQLTALYENREFEQISALFNEYSERLNVYKQSVTNGKAVEYVSEYDGKSTFDGTVLQRLGWTLLCNFVTVITLGIAYPATLCWKMRWQAKHTIYNGKRLSFDGKGIQLLGKWIVWGLLTIVTLGIYGLWVAKKLEQWKAKHTHVAGEFAALGGTFDGSVAGYLGWNVLTTLLGIVTLGIAVPFVMCWKTKWLCKHRVYDGRRMSFDGNGAQLIGKYMLWWLLTIVTLGVYGLWIPNRILKWQASHTTLTETTECVI